MDDDHTQNRDMGSPHSINRLTFPDDVRVTFVVLLCIETTAYVS